MNKLSPERKAEILKVLCEGNSIRSTARITGAAINTVVTTLKQAGLACMKYQDKELRNLSCQRIECDEIWSFCYAKQRNIPKDKEGRFGYGDVWTFVALEADAKLVLSWHVGLREPPDAYYFLKDVKGRVSNRIQLTTDGHRMYYEAVENTFGDDIDYAMLIKYYHDSGDETVRYSPPRCNKTKTKLIKGSPDMSKVSTSYIERQNLTMRMNMRRFTRLTNGFSKKIENHVHALSLYFMHYNYIKTHKTLANPYPRTPAMAAGVSRDILTFRDIVNLIP